MSVCGEAFHISVVISSSEACFIGVITSNQGSGTDSAHVTMGKGDDACSGATSEVRGRAFMVAMVGGPAVSTAPVIGAVTGFMSRVLAMTSETVDMRGEGALLLAKPIPWRGPWVLHLLILQAVFSFAVSRIIVRRSLGCEYARDNAAGGAPWSGAHHVRDKSCPNCCMGEISFYLIFLFFCPQLLSS